MGGLVCAKSNIIISIIVMYFDMLVRVFFRENLFHHTGNFSIYVYILNIIQFEGAEYEKE